MNNIINFEPPKKKEPICAFCKKPKHAVPLLIGEDGRAHICSKCVERCNVLLAEYETAIVTGEEYNDNNDDSAA